MNDLVRQAIDRNYDRILHGERGEQYDGCEDDLREGLWLLAEHGLKYGDSLTSSPRLKPGDSLRRPDSKGTSGLRK